MLSVAFYSSAQCGNANCSFADCFGAIILRFAIILLSKMEKQLFATRWQHKSMIRFSFYTKKSHIKTIGKEATINKLLDGSTYPG